MYWFKEDSYDYLIWYVVLSKDQRSSLCLQIHPVGFNYYIEKVTRTTIPPHEDPPEEILKLYNEGKWILMNKRCHLERFL